MALYLGDKLISSNLAGGDTNPIGSVIAFAGSNAPVGYLMCDGSAVSREIYADLFAVIGTTYGSGDGSTTFNLPDACGRTIVGVDGDDADFDLADTGGAKGAWKHTHPHTSGRINWVNSPNTTNTLQVGSNAVKVGTASGSAKVDYSNTTVLENGSTNNTLPVDIANMPPFLALNYIIKATHNVTIQRLGTIGEDEIVEKKTLLWENPSPTSSFGAQTISLDLSDYDAVEVVHNLADNNTTRYIAKVDIGTSLYVMARYTGPTGICSRTASVSSSGINFAAALDSSSATSNRFMIPYKIYGIKHI